MKYANNYITPGKYTAKAISASLNKAPQGVEFISVIFRMEDQKTIQWAGWFGDDPDKNKRTIESLRYCGWESSDLTDLRGLERNWVMLVVDDVVRGEMVYSKCRFVNPLGMAPKGEMPEDAIRDLSKRMRALCEEVPKFTPRDPYRGPAPKAAPIPLVGEESHHDDDAPF